LHTVQAIRVEETIARFNAENMARCEVGKKVDVRQLLDSISGVGRLTAEVLVAEVDIDMCRFPTAEHLASRAGMCPGSNESAGRAARGRASSG
jgi:transposase